MSYKKLVQRYLELQDCKTFDDFCEDNNLQPSQVKKLWEEINQIEGGV